ncbi:MAG: UDP-N-acetylglucosamine 2-epimerase (non-hydrolyzing) [Acidimicrobiia bacterium]|nr:UDP-N-acetylglucosamine 2-epimerase (non-hydrolyzing) [Acidimicrobiia bacterium]
MDEFRGRHGRQEQRDRLGRHEVSATVVAPALASGSADPPDRAALEHLRDDISRAGQSRIAVVVGTRPEAIKMLPVILALEDSRLFEPVVITTGQHPHDVADLFATFGVTPDVDLSIFEPGLSLAEISDRVVAQLSRRFEATRDEAGRAPLDRVARRIRDGAGPDLTAHLQGATRPTAAGDSHYADIVTHALAGEVISIFVHGDTTSSMGAALAAFYNRLPVGHVEAGLRTDNLWSPYPEELNRRVISQIASLHFAPTARARANLILAGIDAERITVTGNTGVDAFLLASRLPDRVGMDVWSAGSSRRLLVTAHRRENWTGGITRIARAVRRALDAHDDLDVAWVTHPNPAIGEMVRAELDGTRARLLEPVDYVDFSRLLASASAVLTDSGGIQEEAPAAGVPVLVARETTERPEAVAVGCALLVGTDEEKILDALQSVLWNAETHASMARAMNPYGDGYAARRVVAATECVIFGTPAPPDFGSGLSRRAVLAHAGYSLA